MNYENDLGKENMKVSIIIPTFNSLKHLPTTIQSVLKQTYKNWEIIIVDDVSTDKTLLLVNEMSAIDDRIKVFSSNVKLFTSGARNKGISVAKGRFIAFLDSDDMWHTEKLEKQISFMINNRIHSSYTGVEKINNVGMQMGKLIIPEVINYRNLLRGNKICCSSVVLDRTFIENIEFRKDIKIVEDYALWLKILRESNLNAFGINEPLTYYRIHDKAKTSNKLVSAVDTWKVLRKLENLSIIKSIIPFFFYAKDGLRKLLIR